MGDAATNDADFGAPHPALQARQVLGRTLVDMVDIAVATPSARSATPKYPAPPLVHTNGG